MARSPVQQIVVDGHAIKVTNPDKVLYPEEGVTKADVIAHYRAVASVMLPHLAGRPLTLLRYPDGIGGQGFFQKHAMDYFPEWIRRVSLPKRAGGEAEAILCDDEASLVYLASHAALEFHIRPTTVSQIDYPDRLVVDLDPPDGIPVATLRRIARLTRDVYLALGLSPYLQATGGRGFHIVAPLDRSAGFRYVRDLAGDLVALMAASEPDLLTVQQRISKRGDRIFLDVNRNGRGQTFVAPYSLRARPGAGVATPLNWSELGRANPGGHTIATMPKRLGRKVDPWADMDEHAAPAEAARERLDAIRAQVGLR
jgi:bifunctional non-homologous end joining protein LigD